MHGYQHASIVHLSLSRMLKQKKKGEKTPSGKKGLSNKQFKSGKQDLI
jgi:hypothetical protein